MIKKIFLVLISLMLVSTVFSGCLDDSDDDDDNEEETDYYSPVITILSPGYDDQVSGVVEIEVRVIPERPGVEIGYHIDEVLVESSFSTAFSWDTTEEENGQHFIRVTALETGPHVPPGTQPSMTQVRVNVYNPPDIPEEPNTPPNVKMDVPSGHVDGVYSGFILVKGEASDEETKLDHVEMRLDEGEWFRVPVSSRKWHRTIEPGSFTGRIKVEVRAFDGEEYSEMVSLVLECDNTAPDIVFLYPEDMGTISGSVTLQAGVKDDHDLSYISFFIDDNELRNSTEDSFELDTEEFGNGDHVLMIDAKDIVGNYARKSISITIHNNHPPSAVISFPEHGAEYNDREIIHFDASNCSDPDGDDLTYAWESDIDGPLSDEVIFDTTLSPGDHTITLTVKDPDGEQALGSVQITVTRYVNKVPWITITNPENGSIHCGNMIIEGTAGDPDGELVSLEYRVDDGDWNALPLREDWSFTLDTAGLDDGEHTIEVRVKDDEDAAGNASLEFGSDNTAPVVEDFILDPDNIFMRHTVEIEVILDELNDIEFINFDFNGASLGNSSSNSITIDTTRYADGYYFLVINASDELGNVLVEFGMNNSLPLVVDNTPPDIDIEPDDGDYVRNITGIDAQVYDRFGIGYVVFFIDGNELQNSSSRSYDWNTALYPDGEHTITVMASDIAGNINTVEIILFVDNTVPEVTIDAPDDGETVNENFFIEVTAVDPGAEASGIYAVRCWLGVIFLGEDKETPYQLEVDISEYADGNYAIRAIAEDNAGNSDTSTIGITIRDTSGAIISDPHTNYLSPYPLDGIKHIVIHDYKGIPILSPLVKMDISPSVDWISNDPEHEREITYTSLSRFSGNIALSCWDRPDYTVVVDNYRHSLMMAPVAALLDAPLLVYGNHYTDEALWKLDTIYANQIIVMGNTPYNNKGVTVVEENDLLDFALTTAILTGNELNYITLTNPGDESGSADVPHLSAFAAAFAIYHHGLVLPVPPDSGQINAIAHDAYIAFNNSEMSHDFLAIVGDAKSVPFKSANVGGRSAPSDNQYADLDGDLSTVEVPTGRIISKNLPDMSYYLDRIVHYLDYLDTENRPIVPTTPVMGPNWNNNALIYMGWATEHLAWQTSYWHWEVFIRTYFNTQDDTAQAHGAGGKDALMLDFQRANFIAMNADHGTPSSTMTFSSSDLPDMHPGVFFAVSCSLGRIDNTNIQSSMTYTMFEKGMNVYLASTRTTYGAIGVTPEAADGLSLYFWRNLVTDETTGEAMMHAKQDLKEYGSASINAYVCWEYVHYGDPAFNPYEPANEGS